MYDEYDNEECVSSGGCFGSLCYRGGGKPKVWLRITVPYLASLFGAREETIRQWIHRKKFNPTDILSIVSFYNSYTATHSNSQ